MQPIKALKDELVEFGDSLLWENFEATQLGKLTFGLPRPCLIEGEDAPCYYDFYLRVGLHLGQVMQAIMSCGHFVRLRKENRWPKENYLGMKALDPTKPLDNLFRYYPDPTAQYHITPIAGNEHWRPDFGYTTVAPNPYPYYGWQQAQQIPQQTLGGGYVQTTCTGTSSIPYTVGISSNTYSLTGGAGLLGAPTPVGTTISAPLAAPLIGSSTP